MEKTQQQHRGPTKIISNLQINFIFCTFYSDCYRAIPPFLFLFNGNLKVSSYTFFLNLSPATHYTLPLLNCKSAVFRGDVICAKRIALVTFYYAIISEGKREAMQINITQRNANEWKQSPDLAFSSSHSTLDALQFGKIVPG